MRRSGLLFPLLPLAVVVALPACSAASPETLEDCLARFDTHVEKAEEFGAGDWRGIFTYEFDGPADMADLTRRNEGKPAEERASITVASGNSERAAENFAKSEVRPGGAYFISDDISLFRTTGTAGTLAETVESGCNGAPEGAKLIRIDWVKTPKDADN